MSGVIYFRFKSEKDKCTIPIDCTDITVKMLKDRISDLKKLKEDMTLKKKGPNPNYSLLILNPITGEELVDDKTTVSAGSFVIAKRVLSSNPNTIPVHESGPNLMPVDPMILKPREEETVAAALAKMIVTGTLPSILVCSQCSNRLKEPYITGCCGFTACKLCFSPNTCPKCNKSTEIFHDRQLNVFLLNIDQELNDLSNLTEILNNARYFLLQVYQESSLSTSVNTSIWEIPPDNAYRLNLSFQQGRNVILIFVNSATSKFHGFAMLMKPIINRKSGPVINIKWIKRAELDFVHLNRLQSPIHRDALTQPIEEIANSTGLEICLMIEQLESKEEIPAFAYVDDDLEDTKERKRSRSPEEKAKSPQRNKSKEIRHSKQRNSPKRSKHRSKEKHKLRR